MKKVLGALLSSLVFASSAHAGFFDDPLIKDVKDIVLIKQTGITLGKAVESYPYCKSVKWLVQEGDGEKTILMRCKLKTDTALESAQRALPLHINYWEREKRKALRPMGKDVSSPEVQGCSD